MCFSVDMIDIKKNIILASYTTFKIGGVADYFCEVSDIEELRAALDFARQKNLPVFLLGGGSNVLISDKGYRGLVVKIKNLKFKIENFSVEVGAGLPLGALVVKSVDAGLEGLEWAAGIPGTVGGAVRGNAGAFGGEIKDVVEEAEVLSRDGKIKKIPVKDCDFKYRHSIFKTSGDIIWSVTLNLKKSADIDAVKNKISQNAVWRGSHHPLKYPSAGSFFQNIHDKNSIEKLLARDVYLKDNDFAKWGCSKIPAAYLIDRAGLKGLKVGQAQVSPKHPNFIVNLGGASANDAITLAGIIKEKVERRFKVVLREEVQLVGFDSD